MRAGAERFELGHERISIGIPPGRFLGEQPHDDACESRRRVRARVRNRGRLLGDLRREQLLRRAGGEGRMPGEHFVADNAERVEVGAMIEGGIGHHLFRRHVSGRADGDAHAGEHGLG